MKILQISSAPVTYSGGTERVVLEVSKRLAKQGHKVTVVQTDLYDKQIEKGRSKIEGFDVFTFKNNLWLGGLGYSRDLIEWLKENYKNYDIVHSHGYNRLVNELAIKELSEKIPVIFTPHGFIHTKKNLLFKKIHDILFRRFIKKATFCTALTKLDLEDYKKLQVPIERIVEIPNGVDIERFSKVDKEKIKTIKKKYNLKKTLLYVGRIHKSKGLQYVISALRDLDCKLLIIGKDSGFKKRLLEITKINNVTEKVIFIEDVSDKDLTNYYHLSDIFVLFSEWEGFGVVAIEAMAAGKPVIVSNRGALPYVIQKDENNTIVEFKNVQALRESIQNLLRDNLKMKKIGESNKKYVEKFSWDKIIKQYGELYQNAINS